MVRSVENLELVHDDNIASAIEVGFLFQEERKRRNLSVQEVASALHIRQMYINCIETGQFEELPGYVYIVGFIKSYAQFLNLDPEEILRRLALKNNSADKYVAFNYGIPPHKQQHPSLKVLFASLTLLFVIGLSTYIYQTHTPESIGIAPIDESQDIVGSPTQIDDIDKQLAELEVSVPDVIASKEKILSLPSAPQPNVQLSLPNVSGSLIETPKIVIVATQDSWVQVIDKKGANVFVRLMHAGEQYTIPSKGIETGDYILNTGNGGGVKLLIDGQETHVLGEKGKVIRGIELSKGYLESHYGVSGMTAEINVATSE